MTIKLLLKPLVMERPVFKWKPTAVCTAALTIYDMCKSLDKRIKINDVI